MPTAIGCGGNGVEKITVVEGHVVVQAPPTALGVANYGFVGLYEGNAANINPDNPNPVGNRVDEADGLGPDDDRFVLRAKKRNGTAHFYVYAAIKTAAFEQFCVFRQLPAVRVREADGSKWVDARTNRPLASLTLRPEGEGCS